MNRILVTGAGGFIGHHLVLYLKSKGFWVKGVDLKYPAWEPTLADEFQILDLREFNNCSMACQGGIHQVYHLAADMGGIGYITQNHATILRNNALINMHMIEAARMAGVQKYLFTSSACVYPQHLQTKTDLPALKEEDAFPADAEPGYGWEKLFGELIGQYYMSDYSLKTYAVRFHNIFGPLGTFDGGREKSPAALCRKIALAHNNDAIEIWGDGQQTRSYCYIDDCIEGIFMLMQSDFHQPINLGQNRLISINDLVDLIAPISGKKINKRYDLAKPQGVRGRNADLTLIKSTLGWEPRVSLEDGLKKTYRWIEGQVKKIERP